MCGFLGGLAHVHGGGEALCRDSANIAHDGLQVEKYLAEGGGQEEAEEDEDEDEA